MTTAPNVTYKVHLKATDDVQIVNNPIVFPDFSKIDYVEEPFSDITITTDNQVLGDVMKLADTHKGQLVDMGNQGALIALQYHIPTAEIAYYFSQRLKIDFTWVRHA
ncbi:hypothetical protein [Lacticaseibacillus manihotivorans]|uniref:hypothetical protein n=1 Tax=Lacticaseibacillus manihotivorans TaxID=88233 RepID=UPI001FB3CA2A|nr:hypothetical protein [Lacticaseibacillus manihotivorans]